LYDTNSIVCICMTLCRWRKYTINVTLCKMCQLCRWISMSSFLDALREGQPSRRGHLSVKFPGDSRREIRGALAEAAWNGHAQRRDAFIDQQEHGRCTPTAILLFRRLIRERIEEAESLRCESSDSAWYFNRHNRPFFLKPGFVTFSAVKRDSKYLAKISRHNWWNCVDVCRRREIINYQIFDWQNIIINIIII